MSRNLLGSRCISLKTSNRARSHRSSDRRSLATIGLLTAGLLLAGANVGAQTLPGKPEPMPQVSPPSGDGSASRVRTRDPDRHSAATIRRLQHSLMQGGYDVDAADGVWGPRTIAAVREFQRVKGLPVTGRADARTLAALGVTADGAAGAMPAPPVRQWTPRDLGRDTVLAIQRALDQQGFKVGSIDGVWGERTTTAIGNLQRARGMPASGEPDAYTLTLLGLLPGGTARADQWRAGDRLTPAQLDPAAIRLIQQSLGRNGYDVTVDGTWGERTENALREFQRRQGLEPRGEPDVYTLASLGLLPGGDPLRARAAPR
jgi:peptidoglycan hydrolase-like protein with peptidoglycan-binding domain